MKVIIIKNSAFPYKKKINILFYESACMYVKTERNQFTH